MNVSRLTLTAVAMAATSIVTLAACSGSTYGGNGAGSTSSPSGNATFTYDTYSQVMVAGWDPATEYANGVIVMSEMYQTLTRYDAATRQVNPLLATNWNSSKDSKTWTFRLRHGVRFHDGRLLTAQAARAAIERTITLNSGASYIWGAVSTIDVPDDYTLVFHLKYAAPLDREAAADYSAFIYDVNAAGTESKLQNWLNAGHDAGTGPYEVQSWSKGQEFEVMLTSYPGYWGGWSGSHYTRVVFRVVPQATTAAQLLRTGQVTFVEQTNPSLWASFRNNPSITLIQSPSWQNVLALFNTQTLSLPVRQALSYAIDYQGILTALRGAGTKASGIIPAGLPGYTTNLPAYGYDPAKAKRLLNSIGYGPGKQALNLTLTYNASGSSKQVIATLMKSSLASLNVNLSVQPLAWATQWAKARSKNASQHQDILLMDWWPDYADPHSWFVNLLETQSPPYYNASYYSNAMLDSQITAVEPLVTTNPSAAAALYRQMQVTVLQQAPLAVLYTVDYQYAMATGVRGFTVNPAYPNVVFAYDLTP
jgi:peptide/nickel transport system substrate-binding protein